MLVLCDSSLSIVSLRLIPLVDLSVLWSFLWLSLIPLFADPFLSMHTRRFPPLS